MKYWRNVVSMLICLTLSGVSMMALAGPKISCEKPVWEFEKVMEGKEVSHSFKIKNTGDETLTLDNVRATCGCTAVKPLSKVLKPGEETEIESRFNTTGRTGKQTKYVYVHSNDPETKVLKLTITGEVDRRPAPQIILSPPSWNLQTIDGGTMRETNITISNNGDKPLEIDSVTPSTEQIKTNFSAPVILQPKEKMALHITYESDFMGTTIREKIAIKSNDPKRGQATLNIYGSINTQNRGLSVFILKVMEEEENKQIEIYVKNNETYPLNLKVPDAREPNATVIAPKSAKRLNLTLPRSNEKEASEDSSDTIPASQSLKMEISVPLPASASKTLSQTQKSASEDAIKP